MVCLRKALTHLQQGLILLQKGLGTARRVKYNNMLHIALRLTQPERPNSMYKPRVLITRIR